ncbi:hypothetical protein [Streptomyces sp. NPDC046909]|uniref:hypothetical protein n=1 Tax=Streptomyces sp. NPDC046909 TaxID=3155617 RepID=UPI0033E32439
MGRRTVRWRGVCLALSGALSCTAALLLPGQGAALAADSTPSPSPSSYGFAPDVRTVTGASSAAGAGSLELGATYKSSLPEGGKLYYSVVLDDTSDTYVSVTAVPRARTKISAGGGIRVYLQADDSHTCSGNTSYFGSGGSPRPIAAWGARETFSKRTSCKEAGTYYVVVERLDGTDPSPDTWDLELAPMSEPGVKGAEGTTEAPKDWDSESPKPPTGETGEAGEAVRLPGGPGFDGAVTARTGAWSADLTPGQTLFYEVPVDWGRRLQATAELDGAATDGGYVIGALTMSLYNPARVPVDDATLGFNGTQKSRSLPSLPPVAYDNRYAATKSQSAMRFAGGYYLALHLSERMAEEYGDGPFGVTLRVRVDGSSEAAPEYVGESEPRGVFEVAVQDRGAGSADGVDAGAEEGGAGGGAGSGGGAVMKVVAAAGIGGGTLVLVVLGAWTVVARRRGGAW